MRPSHLGAAAAGALAAILVAALPISQVSDVEPWSFHPGNVRSYYAEGQRLSRGWSNPIVLDQSVQARNGLILTDILVHTLSGTTQRVGIEIREGSNVKAKLGRDSFTDGSISDFEVGGEQHARFESGLPIAKGSSLEVRLWNDSNSPADVFVTISGYVW